LFEKVIPHVGRPSEQQSGDGDRIRRLPRLIALVLSMPSDGNKLLEVALSTRVLLLTRLHEVAGDIPKAE
jgi:hypothetical protein